MKTSLIFKLPCFCLLTSAICLSAFGQGSAFTYQGRLQNSGNPANGSYDLTFTLFNALSGPSQVGSSLTNTATAVSNGLFTVTMDFGPGLFTGTNYWLQIGVRTNGNGTFTVLSPRQQLTPAPYAIMANSASNLLGALPAAQLSGTIPLAQLPGAVLTNNESSVTLTNLTLNGALNFPATTGGPDIIRSGSALLLYSDGNGNFFSGQGAGNLTMSGVANTAIGNSAFVGNTTGGGTAALGYEALANNTSGIGNTAIGYSALLHNTNGSDNTATGGNALYSNTSGSDNTANGFQALFFNTSGTANTANGYEALENNTIGNYNTANGFQALFHNTNGTANTANGYQALFSNASGSNNTVNGYEALNNNTSGSWNTADGYEALFSNTSGLVNTANGYEALFNNTSGSYNTASGNQALDNNTTGSNNTANGTEALFANFGGSYNTAAGVSALINENGDNNTAMGANALYNNQVGNNNIALGFAAGYNLTGGSSNIDIGSLGLTGDTKIIRIGAQGTQTATFIAGVSGATAASGVAVFVNSSGQLGTLTSSRRFKDDIQRMDQSSDVLYSLKPVTFKYKPGIDPQGIPQFGLVAEDVEKVAPELVARDDQGKVYTVRYQAVDAMLLNEFLKEHRKVEEQNTKLQELNQKVDAQNSENTELKRRLDALEKIIRNQKSNKYRKGA